MAETLDFTTKNDFYVLSKRNRENPKLPLKKFEVQEKESTKKRDKFVYLALCMVCEGWWLVITIDL